MGIPVRRGRVFTAQDTDQSSAVVISETLARRYFAGQDPVGQRLLLGRQKIEMQIVGVVGDVKHNNLRNQVRPEFYLPLARFTPGTAGLVVRTAGDPASMMAALQGGAWAVGRGLAGEPAGPGGSLACGSLAPGPTRAGPPADSGQRHLGRTVACADWD